MYPVIELFGLQLSVYGIFTAVGLILMGLVAIRLSQKFNIKTKDIIIGEIFALMGALIGAHILYGFTNLEYIIEGISQYISNGKDIGFLWNIISTAFGGMVFYGGLLGALGFGVLYCAIRKIDTAEFADSFAVGIPLFHAFGRIGCFFSGCCFGIESSFGFTAENSLIDLCNGVNRFPVQLLESGLNIVLFIVLVLLFYKGILKGSLIYVYLFLYSIVRFFDEFLRGDTYRGIYFGLSTSQWISIILFIVSLIILIKKIKNRQNREFVYRG